MLGIQAPAKVNLSLRVLAREDSGFHQLETLFAALDFGDSLTVSPSSEGVSLDTDGPPMGPPEENLVYRAAVGFLERSRLRSGVEITLKKRIPLKSGLGGGSSDAAATLKAMDALFPGALAAEDLRGLAGELGSDVPFFLSPSPLALAWGRGNRIAPLPPLPRASVILALPPVAVSTPEAYALLARHRSDTGAEGVSGMVHLPELSTWTGVEEFATNDFEDVVLPAHPLLGRLKSALRNTGPLVCLLSGSGSALFGVYGSSGEASMGLESLEESFPNTRFVLTSTLERMPEPSRG